MGLLNDLKETVGAFFKFADGVEPNNLSPAERKELERIMAESHENLKNIERNGISSIYRVNNNKLPKKPNKVTIKEEKNGQER